MRVPQMFHNHNRMPHHDTAYLMPYHDTAYRMSYHDTVNHMHYHDTANCTPYHDTAGPLLMRKMSNKMYDLDYTIPVDKLQ